MPPYIGGVDAFFQGFPGFIYDSSATPAKTFKNFMNGLANWHDWDRCMRWKKYEKNVEKRYQVALTQEFNLWFGREDDMSSWSALCRAVRIDPVPATIEECREAVENRHVNIVDLIHWARKGEGIVVEIFKTVKKLSDYSYRTNKVYNKKLKEGVVLRYLLRPLAKARREIDVPLH